MRLANPAIFLLFTLIAAAQAELPSGLRFTPGPLNQAVIEKDGQQLAIYGASSPAAMMLITHARRDLVEFARPGASANGILAPEASAELLRNPQAHWDTFWTKRLDYYGQENTRWPVDPIAVLPVKEGAVISFNGLKLRVLAIPGYTQDMVAYATELGGKKIIFSGDILQAGGKVTDLYSFQNEIKDAKVGAYHGYGGRLGPWVESLRRLEAEKPDLLVPLRGPLIENPAADIRTAISRAQAIYRNFLSTNALNWYFGEARLRQCGEKVLGPGAEVELMPFSEHIDLPAWCQHIGTTKLLIAEDKTAFVLDIGGQKQLETLRQVIKDGLVTKIEGIWVTHTHNDHTQAVAEGAQEWGCPVYGVAEVTDVLAYPGNWHLPGTTAKAVPVASLKTMKEGETWKWKEFTFTSHFFPGQMYNHGALLVQKPGHDPVYFIGDSFSPSGIDDYCLMNRNLMRDDSGYLLCLQKVRALPAKSWLVNQHIPHLFRFNEVEMAYLETRYREREKMIAEFVAWDDVNYGIDEEWAWFYPYGLELKPGASAEVEIRFFNHSRKERTFAASFETAAGLQVAAGASSVTIPARGQGVLKAKVTAAPDAKPGVRVITASIRSEGIDLSRWCESLVKISEP